MTHSYTNEAGVLVVEIPQETQQEENNLDQMLGDILAKSNAQADFSTKRKEWIERCVGMKANKFLLDSEAADYDFA